MDTSSVEKVLSISPPINYNSKWSLKNMVLQLDFISNFTYNTSYVITIGSAVAANGGILENKPFMLSFKTEQEIIIPIFIITSPNTYTNIKPNEIISVMGTSNGLNKDTLINVTIEGRTETGIINADGTGYIDLTPSGSLPGEAFNPSFSPDGSRIIFYVQEDEGDSDIYIMNDDGSNIELLIDGEDMEFGPVISPDSKYIFYSVEKENAQNIWRANINGNDKIQIGRFVVEIMVKFGVFADDVFIDSFGMQACPGKK